MSARELVVVVEDEAPIAAFLETLLSAQGLDVVVSGSIADALVQLTTRSPSVVLLDLGLPDGDGLELVRRLRAWSTVPVIVLSARGREADKVEALDAGADDYLTKPFGAAELLARLRVALRRRARAADQPAVVSLGRVEVDLALREVRVEGQPVALTPIEYRLLEVFVQHPGRVLPHTHLLKEVWGPAYVRHTHYVRVHMHALRKKIEADPNQPTLLLTETGVGYRLREPGRDGR